jgi:hypothetical protein
VSCRPLLTEYIHLLHTCSSPFENDHFSNMKHPEVDAVYQEAHTNLDSNPIDISPEDMSAFEELPEPVKDMLGNIIDKCRQNNKPLRIALCNDFDWMCE